MSISTSFPLSGPAGSIRESGVEPGGGLACRGAGTLVAGWSVISQPSATISSYFGGADASSYEGGAIESIGSGLRGTRRPLACRNMAASKAASETNAVTRASKAAVI